MERLKELLKKQTEPIGKWVIGFIPRHYKRLNIPIEEAIEIARYGFQKVSSCFKGDVLFFTQSLIAGAILLRKYKTIIICTPSQYGKSWTLGRVALVKALLGHSTLITAPNEKQTRIIMGHMFQAIQHTYPEIEEQISPVELNDIKRLGRTVSKHKLSVGENYIETISMKDTLSDNLQTDIIGRGEDFFVDEADLGRSETFAEMGRRDFAGIDGEKNLLVMISNPHRGGYFYERLTEENPPEDTLIIWADALTAVEEGEFTAEQVLSSDFAKNPSTRTRYLLCELERNAYSMYAEPIIREDEPDGLQLIGIDSAHRGKDNISICRGVLHMVDGEPYIHVAEIAKYDKRNWVDGVSEKDVADSIIRVYQHFGVVFGCMDEAEGGWYIPRLKDAGLNIKGISFGERPTPERVKAGQYSASYATNMRAEMHLDVQDLMQEGHLTYSPQAYSEVKDTIPHITMEHKAGGKVQIVPKINIKNQIGRSPDEWDSLLLMVHAVIVYNAENIR